MSDEYRSENTEETGYPSLDEAEETMHSTTDSGLKEEAEVESQGEFTSEEGQDGFCFEENRSGNVDTAYRQPNPETDDYESRKEGGSSYGDIMQARMENMNQDSSASDGKYAAKERKRLKKAQKRNQKKSGKGAAVAAAAVACVVVLAGIGGTAYGLTRYIDNNYIKKTDLLSTVNSGQTADSVSQSGENSGSSIVAMDVSGVVKEVEPSVVAITESLQYTTYYNSIFGQLQGQTQEATASGSGVIIGKNDTELLIVTNNHVVSNDGDSDTTYSQYKTESVGLTVEFADGSTGDAYVKGTDESMDLAVIAVELDSISADTMSQIKIAATGDSDNCEVGNGVIAIGNALGYGQSTTVGYISALNRVVTTEDGYSKEVIQVDAAINPGNSGGGLFNTNGELIGINSAKIADEDVEGIGYAIPISDAQDIIDELMNRTPVPEGEEGYLGVTSLSVPDTLVEGYGYPAGASVTQVTEGTPAAEAGLRVYDIITAVNGRQVTSAEQLTSSIQSYAAGETVELTVMRAANGNEFEEMTISVTLARRADFGVDETEEATQQAFIFR